MDKSEQSVSIYNKIAKLYDVKFSNPSKFIDEFIDLVAKNGKILDIGCGTGTDAGYMASKGFEIIGIDLSEEMLKAAKKKFPHIDFRIADMRKLTFDKEQFDGIFTAFSLFHLPKKDVPNVLKNLYDFLKPNGPIYITIQEGKSEEIFINEPLKLDEKIFLNIMSSKEIKELIENAGFVIIKQHRIEPIQEGEFQFAKLFTIARKVVPRN